MTTTRSTSRQAWLVAASVAVGFAVGQAGCSSGGGAAGPAAAPVASAAAPTPTPRPAERKVPVVYSASPLVIGRAIVRTSLEVREVLESEAPAESYPSNPDEVVGKIAATDILPGTPLVRRLYRETKVRGLADMVSPGMRGVAIKMTAELAGPFLRSGHRVDVMGTFSERTADNQMNRVTRVVIRGAKVLAVDIRFDPGAAPGGSQPGAPEGRGKDATEQIQGFESPYKGKEQVRAVVLEVPPGEAQKLTLCSEATALHLAMCGDSSGTDSSEVIKISDATFSGQKDEGEQSTTRIKEVVILRGEGEQKIVLQNPDPAAPPVDDDDDAPLWQLQAAGRPIRAPRRASAAAVEQPEEPVLDEGAPAPPSLPNLPQ